MTGQWDLLHECHLSEWHEPIFGISQSQDGMRGVFMVLLNYRYSHTMDLQED